MKKNFLLMFLTTSALISADLTNIKTLKTSFIQEIKNSSNNVIIYEGKMYAKKNNNLALWIYDKPVKKEIYYRNGNITIIEPDLEQATFAKLKTIPNIITLLKNAKKISKNKLITVFNNIKYTIVTDKNFVKYIVYKDEMQNQVLIKFINPQINQNLNDDIFIYKIPAGYDILKQ